MPEIRNPNRGKIADQIRGVHIDVLHGAYGDQVVGTGGHHANQRKTYDLARQCARGAAWRFGCRWLHILGGVIARVRLAVRELVDPVNEINRALLHFYKYPAQILPQYTQAD